LKVIPDSEGLAARFFLFICDHAACVVEGYP